MSAIPAVQLEEVSLRYKRNDNPALDNVCLSVPQNSICGLLGRNAAGKTTLLSLIAAYQRPTSGTVKVFNQDPYENPEIAPQVAFIFQDNNKDSYTNSLKVFQYLEMGRRLRAQWDDATADHLLGRFELPENKTLGKLSQGQRAVVRCIYGIASHAPLTIFDEAYLGMDAVSRRIFIDELLDSYCKHPRTILFSTHYVEEMERLFSELVIIDKARLLVHEDADTLRAQGTSLADLFIKLTTDEAKGLSYETIA